MHVTVRYTCRAFQLLLKSCDRYKEDGPQHRFEVVDALEKKLTEFERSSVLERIYDLLFDK